MIELPEPGCRLGYTHDQIVDIMGDQLEDFYEWMYGQTGAICEGRQYNRKTGEYEEACGGVAHGTVCYRWDVERYIEGGIAKEIWD